MRILADENVDRPIVLWLREQGHDVSEATVAAPGRDDESIVQLARTEDRVLLTFDRHIGGIVLFQGDVHPGVVYLRLRGSGKQLWHTFRRVWPRIERVAPGHFITARNDHIVVRTLARPETEQS